VAIFENIGSGAFDTIRITEEGMSPGSVGHEGEVLEDFATKYRDRRATLKSLKRTMKRYGQSWIIVADRPGSYGAAMKVNGNLGDGSINPTTDD
jgi:hypothetical protein